MEEKDMKKILKKSLRHAAYMAEEKFRLSQLKTDLDSIALSNGMGEGGGGGPSDRVGAEVLRRERITKQIAECEEMIRQHGEEMARIHYLLFRILTDEERKVIFLRYSGGKWDMVCRKLHMSRSNMFRIHESAVKKLCEHWEDMG